MTKVKAPNRDQFQVQKIKVLKDGGIEITHTIAVTDGSVTATESRTHTSPNIPHPDFIDSIRSLNDMLCKSVGMFDFQTVLNSDMHEQEERRAAKTLNPIVEKFIKHRLSMVQVNGISLSGEGKNEGVIISGKFTTPNNAAIAINSPRIIFERDAFKFENELLELCNRIVDEAYEYSYEGKKAQVSLLDNEEFEGEVQGEMFAEEEVLNENSEVASEPSIENLKKNLKAKKSKPEKQLAPEPAKKKKKTKLSKQVKKKKKK